MATQKIIKIGNSLAITLPASFIKESKYKAGDEVAVEYSGERKMMYIKPKKMSNKIYLSPDFFLWLEEATKKYEPVLKELANK